jgi:hypothetical protein
MKHQILGIFVVTGGLFFLAAIGKFILDRRAKIAD